MRYALLSCAPAGSAEPGPGETAEDAETAGDARFAAYLDQVRDRDVLRGGARLRPASDATTVRVHGDEVLLTDGPFVASEEYLAGIDIIEVADLDEAIALAARHPAALAGGSVEVRPVRE